MKVLTLLAASALVSSCAIDSMTGVGGKNYESFDGKFINQSRLETNQPSNATSELADLRAAADHDLINNPHVERYLQNTLEKLIAQWPKPFSGTIKIVVSTEANYTASSTPNTIVIAQGVLGDADSDDEIAFIMAHELSHILLGHHRTNDYFAKQSALVDKATDIAMSTAVIKDVETEKTANGYTLSRKGSEQSQDMIMDSYRVGLSINRLSRDMVSSSMSRGHEDEADLLGLDLMIKAGYSPRVFTTVFDRMERSLQFNEMQLKAKKQDVKEFVTVASDGDKHLQSDNSLSAIGYLFANEAVTQLLQQSSERHHGALERKKSVSAYLKREYKKERRRKTSNGEITQYLKRGEGHVILENYWNASEAMKAIESGDLKTAENLAQKAISGPTKYHPYPRLAFYAVRKMQQQPDKAVQNLNMIRDWDYASIQTFSLAAQSYRQQNQSQKALATLDKATKTIGTPIPFLPEYISVYKANGNSEKLTDSLEKCKKVKEENIVAKCYISAGVVPEDATSSGEGLLNSLNSFLKKIEI